MFAVIQCMYSVILLFLLIPIQLHYTSLEIIFKIINKSFKLLNN